jgi:hypothetical protein
MNSNKVSFEQAINQVAKEYGLDPDDVVQNKREEIIKRLRNTSSFFRWDLPTDKHYQLYKAHKCNCFYCLIGWARKDNLEYPFFDYEQELYQAIEEQRYVWVKKSAGLGISTFMLYYIAYKSLTSKNWKGKQVPVVTGPNQDIAISLIQRLKALFPPNVLPPAKETVCNIGSVHVQAFPSYNIDSVRGLEKPICIWLDEADYWGSIKMADDAREAAERYIGKSPGLSIVLTSTPGNPDGLFQQIEKAEHSLYHRMVMTYERGLGKIYTEQEIAKAQESPSWLREYCGQYIGFEGNVFNPDKIQQISERGALLERKRLGLIPREWEKVLSIDPGYSSSRYAMVVTTIEPESGVIEVLYAKEVQNADFNEMLDEIMRIWNNYNLFKIYVDGSAVETIRSIKNAIGEYSGDWNALIKRYESKGWDPADYMKVLPINFRVEAREMLAHLK